MLRKRVEVLFEPSEYHRLEELAQAKRRSVGSLVREAVEQLYLQPSREERLQAVERLASQNFDFGSWEEVKEEIIRGKIPHIEAD
jgi:predicted transcriptional regulator